MSANPAPFFTSTQRQAVSDSASPSHTAEMTDQELEEHIETCGVLMLAAYARYEASGCFGDRGTADMWMRTQAEAIKARSPAQVARLDAAKGVA